MSQMVFRRDGKPAGRLTMNVSRDEAIVLSPLTNVPYASLRSRSSTVANPWDFFQDFGISD